MYYEYTCNYFILIFMFLKIVEIIFNIMLPNKTYINIVWEYAI